MEALRACLVGLQVYRSFAEAEADWSSKTHLHVRTTKMTPAHLFGIRSAPRTNV